MRTTKMFAVTLALCFVPKLLIAATGTPSCTVSETAGRVFTVTWSDPDVFRYVLERRVGDRPWYWRGRMHDDDRATYTLVDNAQPIAPEGVSVQYRLLTRAHNESSPAEQDVVCTPDSVANGSQQITEVSGRWEIVDAASGAVVRWQAANVRTDKLARHPLERSDIQALSTRFNSIRLSMHWSQIETDNNVYDKQLVARIRDILDWSAEAGLHVILDPVHLGGGDDFWIPGWAWRAVLPGQKPSRERSFRILQSSQIRDYLAWIMSGSDQGIDQGSGLGSHPAVVAVEVVNEPHPPGSRDAWKTDVQVALLREYQRMIEVIRAERPGIIVVLGAFYGGTVFDNGLVPRRNALVEVLANTPNLVWSAHNYFTGIEAPATGPDYDSDGSPDIDGQGWRGVRGAGIWGESWQSAGCYTDIERRDPNSDWTCEFGLPNRSQAQLGHANNAANHDRIAQEAGMPFFIDIDGAGIILRQEADLRSLICVDWRIGHGLTTFNRFQVNAAARFCAGDVQLAR